MSLDEAPDVFGGKYPGAMKMLAGQLERRAGRLHLPHDAAALRRQGRLRAPPQTQEEVYFVVRASCSSSSSDEVIDVPAGTVVRVAPGTVRSVWNERPEEAELVIVSTGSRTGARTSSSSRTSGRPDAQVVPYCSSA